jgi:disulfide bond formation protein DsbB
MTSLLSQRLNMLGLLAIAGVLAVAFADQLLFGDLPCPLCLLQRAGFAAAGVGLALNLRFGPRPSHYAVTILSAVAGAAISLRQVALHIVPGTGSYGNPFFGMHFYTWAFLLFAVIIVGTAFMLLFERQFEKIGNDKDVAQLGGTSLAIFLLFGLLTLGNGISTLLECGGGLCPDNPTDYLLLKR